MAPSTQSTQPPPSRRLFGSPRYLNQSHNGLSAYPRPLPQVLVTSAAWPQREAFLEQLRAGFRSLDPRFVYYPGSREKLEKFQKCVELVFKI